MIPVSEDFYTEIFTQLELPSFSSMAFGQKHVLAMAIQQQTAKAVGVGKDRADQYLSDEKVTKTGAPGRALSYNILWMGIAHGMDNGDRPHGDAKNPSNAIIRKICLGELLTEVGTSFSLTK